MLESETEIQDDIDTIALLSLAGQHFSVTWTQRTAEFASFLFLIDLFPTTLLPSALYGFFTTLAGVLFGGNAGSFVDKPSRLKVIRVNIIAAKLAVASLYSLLLVMTLKFSDEANEAGRNIKYGGHAPVWVLFSFVGFTGCIMKLSDIAMSVAIERDWVTTIAGNSEARLTRLNLWMRRIDLGCKLIAPLFTGLLAGTVGNTITIIICGCIALGGLGFELVWINIVWKRFPELHSARTPLEVNVPKQPCSKNVFRPIQEWANTSYKDWHSFINSPVFPSSLSISLLYFTTLSFDGTMISWLKTNTYSDALISGMRGIAVCTGLVGTALMPILEKRVGLARAGNWSIWYVVLPSHIVWTDSVS